MKKHIISLLAILSIAGCKEKKAVPADKPATLADTLAADRVVLSSDQLKQAGIKTGKAAISSIHSTLVVNGTIEVPPENRYTISFPMGGYLKSNKLVPGTYVHKGALMATLEDAQFIQLQQDFLVGKSKLTYTEADYRRQEELNKTQSASDKVLQQAKAEFESQKVILRSLSEKLKLIGIDPGKLNENNISRTVGIYAPINGYVNQVNVNPGKYIAPTDVLFELTDVSQLHLSLTVFEKDAALLQPGQKVIFYTNTAPDHKMEATIHLINRNIGSDNALSVHCDLQQHYPGLMPGVFVNAAIQQARGTANTLPENAIVRWQNKYYLFVAEQNNSFIMKEVSVGQTSDGRIQVLSPLPSNDIVLENAYALLMMLKNRGEEE